MDIGKMEYVFFFFTSRIKCWTKRALAKQYSGLNHLDCLDYTTVVQTVLKKKFSISNFPWEN